MRLFQVAAVQLLINDHVLTTDMYGLRRLLLFRLRLSMADQQHCPHCGDERQKDDNERDEQAIQPAFSPGS